ncbi:VOC family protein [Pseudoroseicyclus sp. CXY001]|uniref:VOC family protein n=1 Tax=Pseudoroseicyclus sp. CXY001 TaxID=3242492 RepID=UPI003571525E
MTPQRVTLITLGVADPAAAEDFYAALGWEPHPRSGGGVTVYQMNGMALALFGREALAADQGRPGAALGTGAMALAQYHGSRDAVDAAFETAVSAGATALKAPAETAWGGYLGYFADPDGHVWELAHNPFWPLAGDGALWLPDPGS